MSELSPRPTRIGTLDEFLQFVWAINLLPLLGGLFLLAAQVWNWLVTATWQPPSAADIWARVTNSSLDVIATNLKGVDLIVNYLLFDLPAFLFFLFVVPLSVILVIGALWLVFNR